jgi:hypothetical protein
VPDAILGLFLTPALATLVILAALQSFAAFKSARAAPASLADVAAGHGLTYAPTALAGDFEPSPSVWHLTSRRPRIEHVISGDIDGLAWSAFRLHRSVGEGGVETRGVVVWQLRAVDLPPFVATRRKSRIERLPLLRLETMALERSLERCGFSVQDPAQFSTEPLAFDLWAAAPGPIASLFDVELVRAMLAEPPPGIETVYADPGRLIVVGDEIRTIEEYGWLVAAALPLVRFVARRVRAVAGGQSA